MSDIITAISTALAPSGIGVIRLSGDGCARLCEGVTRPVYGPGLSQAPARSLRLYDLFDRQGRVIDRILAVRTPGPGSYTGEDTVELQCHGSPAVLREAVAHLIALGARQAGPGEFTKRAFLNGRMDLTAAEAVIDLIEAETAEAAANAAGQVGGALLRKLDPVYEALTGIMSHFHAVLDYPDEDIDDFALSACRETLTEQLRTVEALLSTADRGRVVKNGAATVILGRPNAGKSSILNTLAGYERVIVTDIPGTTRDTVEEKLRLGSVLLRLTDTAGIRESADPVEKLGVERSLAAAREADLAILVVDGSVPLGQEDRDALAAAKTAKKALCLLNKSDLPRVVDPAEIGLEPVLQFSAKTGEGLQALTAALEEMFAADAPCDGTLLTNLRHETALQETRAGLLQALEALDLGVTPDAVLLGVEEAMEAIAALTGRSMREDITNGIFSRFCVGK